MSIEKSVFGGGIYDDRLLVKPTKSAISYMPTASYELPYEGAKESHFSYYRRYNFISASPHKAKKST